MELKYLIQALMNKQSIYAIDCEGVEKIDFNDKSCDFAYDEVNLYKIDKNTKLVFSYYFLNDLYKTKSEAHKSYENLGIKNK